MFSLLMPRFLKAVLLLAATSGLPTVGAGGKAVGAGAAAGLLLSSSSLFLANIGGGIVDAADGNKGNATAPTFVAGTLQFFFILLASVAPPHASATGLAPFPSSRADTAPNESFAFYGHILFVIFFLYMAPMLAFLRRVLLGP